MARVPNINVGSRDNRTFAEAVTGGRMPPPTTGECSNSANTMKSIQVNFVSAMEDWICNPCNLIGEVLSIGNLSNLTVFLGAENMLNVKLHYAGGLYVSMVFESPLAAGIFSEKRFAWEKNFRWLNIGEIDNLRFENVGLDSNCGVPTHLRDETNLKLIASNCGKVLEIGDWDPYGGNLLAAKACVLTVARANFNEEAHIVAWGKFIKLALWNMKKLDSLQLYVNGELFVSDGFEEDDDKDDDDGVSETWDKEQGDVILEEGEIPNCGNDVGLAAEVVPLPCGLGDPFGRLVVPPETALHNVEGVPIIERLDMFLDVGIVVGSGSMDIGLLDQSGPNIGCNRALPDCSSGSRVPPNSMHSEKSIDLNKGCASMMSESKLRDEASYGPFELLQTVNVGKDIGFQIDKNNNILKEFMVVSGEFMVVSGVKNQPK
ncbi:hypothetical protein L2E82_13897 [Cichorium intybus]|uniref:Uncharacterized protein n=1 Tax=Cichorium intybus TaxID=13427 RepID=A0ACB9EXX6_CICIN|nr:hypothetical protein L2E82_13897 [Cichorium intybus]